MSFISVFLQHLTDTSHGVRNKCLQLLGNLGSLEKSVTKDTEGLAVRDVQKIIGDYFSDQDPRVRTAAIKAMVNRVMETKWGQFCLFVFHLCMANATLHTSWISSPGYDLCILFRKAWWHHRAQKQTFLHNKCDFLWASLVAFFCISGTWKPPCILYYIRFRWYCTSYVSEIQEKFTHLVGYFLGGDGVNQFFLSLIIVSYFSNIPLGESIGQIY